MNLGSANLKAVTSSRPQLVNSPSEQSITATDDYYSFSDYASETSSAKSPQTVVRYATPPSHARSPHESKDKLESEQTLPTTIKANDRADAARSSSVKFDKSVTDNEGRQSMSRIPENSSPPTPGVDDTPYIRFAIDQLTRDEELLGARPSVSEPDYPVDRIIPDEGLNYYQPGPKRQPPQEIPTEPATPSPTHRRLSYDGPRSPQPVITDDNIDTPERFIPVEPDSTFRHPSLDFVPIGLRPFFLLATIIMVGAMVAGLLFCNIYSIRHQGLWDYTTAGGGRYFVFQFLPQMLAIIIIFWLFVIQSAMYRIIPFCIMASEKSRDGVLQNLPLRPENFVLPDFSHMRHGDRLIGCCLLAFWLANFTVPLQSCLFQSKLEVNNGEGTWRWVANQGVGYTLVALYGFVLLALLVLFFKFLQPWTGLLWDPVGIADLIPMIHRSNILDSFSQSEVTISPKTQIPPRILRLGYWITTHSSDTFYGIGEVDAPTRRFSLRDGRLKEKPNTEPGTFDVEGQTTNRDSNFSRNIHSPFVRYRWIPPYLRDTFVILFVITAIVLFVAFTVVSYLHHAVEDGFDPQLPTLPDGSGFSSSNFLYSFIPSLFGMILFLLYQPIALSFCALQPFANLSSATGTTAEESLLLTYSSLPPVAVTITASINKHYKVAFITFIAFISCVIPILAGGTFTAQFFPSEQKVLMTANSPSYYALTFFLALYAFSFPFIFPTRKRYLPHPTRTIADQVSFVYASPLLRDVAFNEPRTKADLVTRLITDPPGEKERPKYAFGVFPGRDGTEHLGIERLQRPGSMMIVTTGGSLRR